MYISSAINPIIYYLRTNRLRSAFKQFLKDPFGSSDFKEKPNNSGNGEQRKVEDMLRKKRDERNDDEEQPEVHIDESQTRHKYSGQRRMRDPGIHESVETQNHNTSVYCNGKHKKRRCITHYKSFIQLGILTERVAMVTEYIITRCCNDCDKCQYHQNEFSHLRHFRLVEERFLKLQDIFQSLVRADKSLLRKVLLVIWIVAGVFGAAGFTIDFSIGQYAWKNSTMNTTIHAPVWLETLNAVYIFVLFTFGLVLPSAVMIFCYSRVIYHVWFNTEANRATNVALFKSRRKLTKLFIILTVTFIITWTPTFGRPIVTQFEKKENARQYQLFCMLLALIGSSANPVIYSFRCPKFRQEAVKLLTFRCCKRKRNRIVAANSYSMTEAGTRKYNTKDF
ncbi:hypothetical protein OS493_029553 [Desmophyllum pertusum]|uniref:G-protein coupled receptors family 1 profile domain-containing protein n=1 Tax=Desmophyllum pertusum TaxID=174260 RepID=A0A9X0D9B2_9CNID|nr:hypothetical protein OS493_029553 [Desmophyllum pertusum]